MGRKSSIHRLPPPVKKSIDDWLKAGNITLDEILDRLRTDFGNGVTPSRSALGRYSKTVEQIGAHLREAREVAAIWAERLGNEPQGDVGKLVMELLRTLAFDATLTMREGGELDPSAINKLALAMQRLEAAGKWNLQREQAMRKAVIEEVAQTAQTAARKRGISEDTADWIRREILGINDDQPAAKSA